MVSKYIEKLQVELRDLELRLLTAVTRGRLCNGCLNRAEDCTCNEEADHEISS
jgi:hypothetical protein